METSPPLHADPLFVLLIDADALINGPGSPIDLKTFFDSLFTEIRAASQSRVQAGAKLEILTVAYQIAPPSNPPVEGFWTHFTLDLGALHSVNPDPAPWINISKNAFPNLESALSLLGTWLLRRPQKGSPILVLHITAGRFKCSGEVEATAATVKTACDIHGAPGIFYTLWITEAHPQMYLPDVSALQTECNTARSLFRMSSIVGESGSALLNALGESRPLAARCLEVVPSLDASHVTKFLALYFSKAIVEQAGAATLVTRAFLVPKEQEDITTCEDVVSVHLNRRCFVISDGVGTASYSGALARTICRHAVETPPPLFATNETPPEDPNYENQQPANLWLKTVQDYWEPEIPWERLEKLPSIFSKRAKEGAAATMAGIRFLDPADADGLRFRGWVLGDSCVIQIRENCLFASEVLKSAKEFTLAPPVVLVTPGRQPKPTQPWHVWEGALRPGDFLLLATDALSEYILRSFENHTHNDLLIWLNQLEFDSSREAWQIFEEFVHAKRKLHEIENDDVALILIKVRSEASVAPPAASGDHDGDSPLPNPPAPAIALEHEHEP